ncbi:dipeptide epimerase [Synechococcus sp. CS-1324]|uniref:dipeptide epimerase n=1 Tax=unclassified Synechococcus TaxID=2626047 RepID=UPI000DB6C21E|nr:MULTISPECIES: dipeptide epimerase [unclassified Synechococcus]MCT0212920.1 dipeptide epimerase [Synechococcus sp. CS-1326]MCT0231499.1 dipeptide epimerase [Synechococcus sp. CS-1324]MCT0233124.1 dipeptide epimerase [Synechococcus sp. CS-1327]PZV03910.1 MAG: dipeptide epimerase [Cyanobium sp.]
MQGRLRRFSLTKLVPLAISRGTTTSVERLLVEVEHEGVVGQGETGGFDTGHRRFSTDRLERELEAVFPLLDQGTDSDPTTWNPSNLQALEPVLALLSPPARCGLDLALSDWWGKRLGLPLWQLWGLDPQACSATSVTLGLGSAEQVLARLERWSQQLGLRPSRVKLKLGSPDGPDHDRALVRAVATALAAEPAAGQAELQVDANGGWDLATAQGLIPWLADQGVVLVEQPLPALADAEADTAGFAALDLHCPIALVADESCWDLADLLRLAPHVDGVNLKLLKSGGLSEALVMARTARRLGLDLMLGCYSDSALLNGAAAQLLPLVRWPDLDSHLNLRDDPFEGPVRSGDLLHPSPRPGLGVVAAKPC